MTEDYAIQQRSQVPGYAIGGGIVGGGAAAALSNWGPAWARDKAKYNSYQDLINEKHDDFVKNNSGDVVNEHKAALDAIEKAGKDYDQALAEHLDKNKDGAIIESDELKAKKAELEKAQENLNKKRAELEKIEAEKLRKSGETKSSGRVDADKLKTEIEKASNARRDGFNSKIDSFVDRKFALLEQLDTAKAKGDKEAVKKLTADVKALESEINTYFDTEVKEWFKNPKSEKFKGEAKRRFESLKSNTTELINVRIDEKMIDSATDTSIGKKFDSALAKVKSGISDKMYDHIVSKGATDESTIKNLTKLYEKRGKNLETLKNAIEEAQKELAQCTFKPRL